MFSRLLGKKSLYKASKDGDLEAVREALASGQSANTAQWSQWFFTLCTVEGWSDRTCLMEAVKRVHQEVVTVLLQQEESVCDINLEDKNKCTALH